MNEVRTYPNAPIVEAILEIRCAPSSGVPVGALEALLSSEAPRYPVTEHLEDFRSELRGSVAPGSRTPVTATAERLITGVAGVSQCRQRVFQARENGFTFAHMRPYPGWAAFRGEAQRLWALYRGIAGAARITRVAIRTINRICLDGPPSDPARYLRTLPVVAPQAGTSVHGFFMQVAVDQPSICSVALITESIDRSADSGRIAVILDIDLFRERELPHSELDLWALLDRMRQTKDDVFEACITEEARKDFRECQSSS